MCNTKVGIYSDFTVHRDHFFRYCNDYELIINSIPFHFIKECFAADME